MVGCGGGGDGCWYVWVDVSGGCDVGKVVLVSLQLVVLCVYLLVGQGLCSSGWRRSFV